MAQRVTEWTDNVNTEYHEKQFNEPYRSTIAFCDWLETTGLMNSDSNIKILDLCSGAGANLYYMSQRYRKSVFVGIDINPYLVDTGNAFFNKMGAHSCRLTVGDICNIDAQGFDGIISLQSLSWLPEIEQPIQSMARVGAKWIAASSLFYNGLVSCKTEVTEYDTHHDPSRITYYNVYSIPVVKDYFGVCGYNVCGVKPFEMDIDLPKPINAGLGTYTEKTAEGERLQISGPLLMPWHFIAAKRAI